MDPKDKWDTSAPSGPETTPPLVIAPPKPAPVIPPPPEDPEDDDDDDDNTPGVTWPNMELIPVKTPVPESNPPVKKTTCKLWFFFVRRQWVSL
jgi:hypothetical protein